MQFSELANYLSQIGKLHSRLAITEILVQVWNKLDPEEIWPTANLIQGRLRPAYEQLVFNLSEKMIGRGLVALINKHGGLGNIASTTDLFGQSDDTVITSYLQQIYRQYGDWGETTYHVHQQLLPDQTSELTIKQVYAALVALAEITGDGSQQEKISQLMTILDRVDAASAKIIVRIVIGKLRLGFSTKTVLDSLSWTLNGDKSDSAFLEEIWQKKADVGLLAKSYLALNNESPEKRRANLNKTYQVEIGVPIVPALCQRLNSSGEIIAKMKQVIAEPKYDGLRVQIHLAKNHGQTKIAAFTRSLENATAMFPELKSLAATLDIQSVIFDSEAVGFQAETNQMLAFQETISRRRKHDIENAASKITLKFFIFDILYLNGQELLNLPLLERKKMLTGLIPNNAPAAVTEFITTDQAETLRIYHEKQLAAGLEGMVTKGEQSTYQSGRKGWQWVKIKEQEGTQGKLNDTLDLVVLGLYTGRGRRHTYGIGAFLTGVIDDNGEIYTITKIGTGLSDQDLEKLQKLTAQLVINEPPRNYHVEKTLIPDTWLAPQLIVEVAADELTHSSVHTSGYGLRFPRVIAWRNDKTAEQATHLDELAQITISKGES